MSSGGADHAVGPWRTNVARAVGRELRLLAAAIAGDAEALEALGRDASWSRAVARNRAAPALALRAQEAGLALPMLPEWRRELFRSAAVRVRLDESKARVARVLGAAGVPWMALKGMALDESVYPNLAERPTNDLDVLVADASFDEARAALAGSGWVAVDGGPSEPGSRPRGYNWAALDESGVRLELHFQLWGSIPGAVSAEVLARAVHDPSRPGGGLVPCRADTYVLHAVHAFIHARPVPLIYWWDLERVARCAGSALVGEVREAVARWQLELFVVLGAAVADELWGGSVHRAIVAALAPQLRLPEAAVLRSIRSVASTGLGPIVIARMLSLRGSRRGVRAFWTGVRRALGR